MDGNLPLCKWLIQAMHKSADSHPCDWIPAVHAGMTGCDHLCITTSAGAWERSKLNGLRKPSQVMVDKPQSVAREKIGSVFGHLDDETMLAVNRALAVFLGFA